jgi:hypothetical protein
VNLFARMQYHEIRSKEIIATVDYIAHTIKERFPDSALAKIAREIYESSKKMDSNVDRILKPRPWLRVLSIVLTLLLVLFGMALIFLSFRMVIYNLKEVASTADFLQGIDSVMSALVLLGGALFFLITGEQKIRRRQTLHHLNELRAVAHVIDLHQLKKDPAIVNKEQKLSQQRTAEYLDYCSDLLSIIGKMAAYYEKNIEDNEVREAAEGVENLTTGLSRKIWQKIMITQLDKHKKSIVD